MYNRSPPKRIHNDLSCIPDNEFIDYLKMVEHDLRLSGKDATADDYKEAIRRFKLFRDANISTADAFENRPYDKGGNQT